MADSYLPIPPTLKAEDWHAYDRPMGLHEVFQSLAQIERKLDLLIDSLADKPTGNPPPPEDIGGIVGKGF